MRLELRIEFNGSTQEDAESALKQITDLLSASGYDALARFDLKNERGSIMHGWRSTKDMSREEADRLARIV